MNSFERQTLDAHNKHRANHQAPPLTWNARLASDAQSWAERLAREDRLKHASTEDGENIFMTFGDLDGNEVVNNWYEEVRNYSFARPGFQSNTGHFSQVVWKGSRELGVGKATGNDGKVFVVARYRPAGNNLRTFDENISPANVYKPGLNRNSGRWDHVNYNDRETSSKLDPYKRYSGRWDYNTESIGSIQEPNKRYSGGWDRIYVNDDRSWIQQETPKKSLDHFEPGKRLSNGRNPVKVKDDQSWIQQKAPCTISSCSEPRKRLPDGYDDVTTSSVKLQESAPSRISSRTEQKKQSSDQWDPVIMVDAKTYQDKPYRNSSDSEPNKRGPGGWDTVDGNTRYPKTNQSEPKRFYGRWDPIGDYKQTFPQQTPPKWDSGKWFDSVNESTASVSNQAAPTRDFGGWEEEDHQENQTKEKANKRHSGRWQPGVNDVMFKEPQERTHSTSQKTGKKQETASRTGNIADRWEKSQKVKHSKEKSFDRNKILETDVMRFHGIKAGGDKTRESIKRWEQNSLDQSSQLDQSYRTRKRNELNRSSQSNTPFRSNPINQSNRSSKPSQLNRSSWPNQSNQPTTERWDPLWREDRPYEQKQRPASIGGANIFEDEVQSFQMAEYQSIPYSEPRERKIITTITDGPKKTVVSSLTITLKGNEDRLHSRSKSSEDLRPKSSYARSSRAPGREAYPYAEGRASRKDMRSKSSEDLRSRGSYTKNTRTPVEEDIVFAERFKPDQRQQPFYDTTDGYREIKPVSKFPSLGHFAQQALDTHNVYRALHGVQNLMWSAELADAAQGWAQRLAKDRSLKHTTRERGGDGENLAMLTGNFEDAAKEAIDTWYNEIKNYNFIRPGYHPKTGHFTQLVWKDSKEFGMGRATTSDGKVVVVVSRYRPGGNVLRQYELNVFPKVDLFEF